jgi:acyl carrier protein
LVQGYVIRLGVSTITRIDEEVRIPPFTQALVIPYLPNCIKLNGGIISMKPLDVLEKFIVNEVAVEHDIKSLAPDEDLLGSGIIDSMAVLKLVTFLEETFGITVKEEDIVPENFQNLKSIVEYVERTQTNK